MLPPAHQLRGSEKVSFGESPAGAAFQILLEGGGLGCIGEGEICGEGSLSQAFVRECVSGSGLQIALEGERLSLV
ncbi:MAG: hypothetical protein RLZZ129_712 [Verrucomicrobiota bacterium]|jgi:hypothetical protein